MINLFIKVCLLKLIYLLFFFSLSKDIPMEILDCTPSYEICMLYYISPTRFYVYLNEKFNSHTSVNNKILF